jgi:hypothetical protein
MEFIIGLIIGIFTGSLIGFIIGSEEKDKGERY